MRRISCFFIIVAIAVLSSCIRDEPKNIEADILEAYFAPEDEIEMVAPPVILNNDIMLMLPISADRSELAPHFILTEGARINPPSGTELDFTAPQKYTVTSEDGKWEKDYTVRIASEIKLKYHFEDYETITAGLKKYHTFYENITEGNEVVERQDIWGSGNPAAQIGILVWNNPAAMPTYAAEGEGRMGSDGELSTAAVMKTVKLNIGIGNMKIAAGNLFIGVFNGASAMSDPLGATEFGFPINKKPVKFKGWYKYTSGLADWQGTPYPADRPDSCSIYAVLYRTEDGTRLNGHNILTSPDVVAKALFKAPAQTTEWKPFENNLYDGAINFEYLTEVDPDDLANNKYNLAVVFTSSHKGAEFKGAIGSTLVIDDVEIEVE